MTVVLKGSLLSRGDRLAFLKAADDQGRGVELVEPFFEVGTVRGQSLDFLPYALNLKVPEGARELNVVIAVSQSHFIEFIAKPNQVVARPE